jgi:DGQHR domain-containing protein
MAKVLSSKKSNSRSKSKSKRKGKPKLTDQQKEQNLQKKEIRDLMSNIGFARMPYIDGKEFVYDDRTSELDDIFYFENIIVLAEYTIGSPGHHLINKKIIFDKINGAPADFIKYLQKSDVFKPLQEILKKIVLSKYTINQLQIKIIYASKQAIALEHKNIVEGICYFDYSIVKYFESIAKVIKRSTKYEFCDFLGIPFSKIGENVKVSSRSSTNDFSGHILPEEHSSFKEGYKLVSFYIDAESLLKRAYVLRKDGWRNKENIGLYQRMFVAKKIKGMRKYLHEDKRVFVNNIIVTLPVDKIRLFDENNRELKIDNKGNFKNVDSTKVTPTVIKIDDQANIIGIIDGQHRSYAYHEGDDIYEETIAGLRGIQNLLVTGILYPKDELEDSRLKFEAKLFLEINSNQSGATSNLKQEIEDILHPFSTISISKYIIKKLNESGPLATMFEEYWYETSKLKTASIISFGLKPLVKFEGEDTLFKIWEKPSKNTLKKKTDSYKLLNEYKIFCTEEVRKIFIGLYSNIDKEKWKIDRNDPEAVLTVTTINGIINCLRLLVENGKNGDVEMYKRRLTKIKGFDFKSYKSSQYRKMGHDIYDLCFL